MAKGKATSTAGEPSQREMVKTALDTLGDVGPTEMQTYIQETYGREIKKAIISSYKSQLKSKTNGGGGAGRGPGRVSGNVDIRDLTAVQELIRRVGAARLSELVKVLSK
jgi:hypothetical protein